MKIFSRWKKLFSLGVILALGFPSEAFTLPAVPAVENQPVPEKLFEDLTAVRVPENIGQLKELYRGQGKDLLILIQDAHAIPDAQRNIKNLVSWLQQEYGIGLVALEGAASSLDASFFKSFPDRTRLEKTFRSYLDEGELTGTTAAAVFNRLPSEYHGVEEWPLYEKGLEHFLKAAAREPELLSRIDAMSAELEKEKEAVYAADLLALDRLVQRFRRNEAGLSELMKALAGVRKPAEGTELALLMEEMKREEGGGAAGAASVEAEVKKIAAKVRRHLAGAYSAGARRDFAEFNRHEQEFLTSRMSAEAFALFLKETAARYRIPVQASSRLGRLVKNQRRLRDIEGTRVFEQLEEHMRTVKAALYGTDEARILDERSERLWLMRRLASMELNRPDWRAVQKMLAQHEAWTVSADGIRGGQDVEPLLAAMEDNIRFYENAEARDGALLENTLDLMRGRGSRAAILVSGGFHAEGLTKALREKGASYLLLMPKIGRLPDEVHYREHMEGRVSWSEYFTVENGKVDLYSAFVRGARDRLLEPEENGGIRPRGEMLKLWRDEILRSLARESRLAEAGEYTRFIDEAVDGDAGSGGGLRDAWTAGIAKFIERFRTLEQSGNLDEASVAGLLRPATIAEAAKLGLGRSELRADLLPVTRDLAGKTAVVLDEVEVRKVIPEAAVPAAQSELREADEGRPAFDVMENAADGFSVDIGTLPAQSKLRKTAEFLQQKGITGVMITGRTTWGLFVPGAEELQDGEDAGRDDVDIVLRDKKQLGELAGKLGIEINEKDFVYGGSIHTPEGFILDIRGWFESDGKVHTPFGASRNLWDWPYFTINKIGFMVGEESGSGAWKDPFGGIEDARLKKLRWSNPRGLPLTAYNYFRFLSIFHGFSGRGFTVHETSFRQGLEQVVAALDRQNPRRADSVKATQRALEFVEKTSILLGEYEEAARQGVRGFLKRSTITLRIYSLLYSGALAGQVRTVWNDVRDGYYQSAFFAFRRLLDLLSFRIPGIHRLVRDLRRTGSDSRVSRAILFQSRFGNPFVNETVIDLRPGPDKLIQQEDPWSLAMGLRRMMFYADDGEAALSQFVGLGGGWILDSLGIDPAALIQDWKDSRSEDPETRSRYESRLKARYQEQKAVLQKARTMLGRSELRSDEFEGFPFMGDLLEMVEEPDFDAEEFQNEYFSEAAVAQEGFTFFLMQLRDIYERGDGAGGSLAYGGRTLFFANTILPAIVRKLDEDLQAGKYSDFSGDLPSMVREWINAINETEANRAEALFGLTSGGYFMIREKFFDWMELLPGVIPDALRQDDRIEDVLSMLTDYSTTTESAEDIGDEAAETFFALMEDHYEINPLLGLEDARSFLFEVVEAAFRSELRSGDEGRSVYDAVRPEAESKGWSAAVEALTAQRTDEDKTSTELMLEMLEPAGVDASRKENLAARIIPVEAADPDPDTDAEGLIVRHGGTLKALFPRGVLLGLEAEGVVRLYGEVLQMDFLEAGMQAEDARHHARRIAAILAAAGAEAARTALEDLRDPDGSARYEMLFGQALREALESLGIEEAQLPGLTDEEIARILDAFFARLETLSGLPGTRAPPLFRRTLDSLIRQTQIRQFIDHAGHFTFSDFLAALQHVHTLVENMREFGLQPAILEHFELPRAVFGVPVTHALRLRTMLDAGLTGEAWDAVVPEAALMEAMESRNYAELARLRLLYLDAGSGGVESSMKNPVLLSLMKAAAVRLGIDFRKMESNYILNLIQSAAGKGVFEDGLAENASMEVRENLARQFFAHVADGLFLVLDLQYRMAMLKEQGKMDLDIERFVARGFDGIVFLGDWTKDGTTQTIIIKLNVMQKGMKADEFGERINLVTDRTDKAVIDGRRPFARNLTLIIPQQTPGDPVRVNQLIEFNEYVRGVNFRSMLDRSDFYRVDLPRNLGLGLQFVKLHAFLNRSGMVNRDIGNLKNLIVDGEGTLKFVDFGNVVSIRDLIGVAIQREVVNELLKTKRRVTPEEFTGLITQKMQSLTRPDMEAMAASMLQSDKRSLIITVVKILTGQHFNAVENDDFFKDPLDQEVFLKLIEARFGEAAKETGLEIYGALGDLWRDAATDSSGIAAALEEFMVSRGLEAAPGTDDGPVSQAAARSELRRSAADAAASELYERIPAEGISHEELLSLEAEYRQRPGMVRFHAFDRGRVQDRVYTREHAPRHDMFELDGEDLSALKDVFDELVRDNLKHMDETEALFVYRTGTEDTMELTFLYPQARAKTERLPDGSVRRGAEGIHESITGSTYTDPRGTRRHFFYYAGVPIILGEMEGRFVIDENGRRTEYSAPAWARPWIMKNAPGTLPSIIRWFVRPEGRRSVSPMPEDRGLKITLEIPLSRLRARSELRAYDVEAPRQAASVRILNLPALKSGASAGETAARILKRAAVLPPDARTAAQFTEAEIREGARLAGIPDPVMDVALEELRNTETYVELVIKKMRKDFKGHDLLLLTRDMNVFVWAMEALNAPDAKAFPGSTDFWKNFGRYPRRIQREFFAQYGIDEESIRSGRQFLLADTGFSGTIADYVRDYAADLFGLEEGEAERIFPARLISPNDTAISKGTLSFLSGGDIPFESEDIDAQMKIFPKLAPPQKDRPGKKGGMTFRAFLEHSFNGLLVASIQTLPAFHGPYQGLARLGENGPLIAVPKPGVPLTENIDAFDYTNNNADIINPAAAMIVQREIYNRFSRGTMTKFIDSALARFGLKRSELRGLDEAGSEELLAAALSLAPGAYGEGIEAGPGTARILLEINAAKGLEGLRAELQRIADEILRSAEGRSLEAEEENLIRLVSAVESAFAKLAGKFGDRKAYIALDISGADLDARLEDLDEMLRILKPLLENVIWASSTDDSVRLAPVQGLLERHGFQPMADDPKLKRVAFRMRMQEQEKLGAMALENGGTLDALLSGFEGFVPVRHEEGETVKYAALRPAEKKGLLLLKAFFAAAVALEKEVSAEVLKREYPEILDFFRNQGTVSLEGGSVRISLDLFHAEMQTVRAVQTSA